MGHRLTYYSFPTQRIRELAAGFAGESWEADLPESIEQADRSRRVSAAVDELDRWCITPDQPSCHLWKYWDPLETLLNRCPGLAPIWPGGVLGFSLTPANARAALAGKPMTPKTSEQAWAAYEGKMNRFYYYGFILESDLDAGAALLSDVTYEVLLERYCRCYVAESLARVWANPPEEIKSTVRTYQEYVAAAVQFFKTSAANQHSVLAETV